MSQAVLLTDQATANTPPAVLDRVRAHGTRIVIIGRQQRLTDMPPFRWLLTYQVGLEVSACHKGECRGAWHSPF